MLQLLQLAEKLKPTTILLWGEPLCCSRGKFISHTYLLQSTCCSFYLFMLMYLPIWVGILSVLSSMYIDISPSIPIPYRYQCIICMNHHTFTYINVWSMWAPLLFALSPLPTYLPTLLCFHLNLAGISPSSISLSLCIFTPFPQIPNQIESKSFRWGDVFQLLSHFSNEKRFHCNSHLESRNITFLNQFTNPASHGIKPFWHYHLPT